MEVLIRLIQMVEEMKQVGEECHITSPLQGTAQAGLLLRECLIRVDWACENSIESKILCWWNGVLVRCCLTAKVQ